MNKGLVLSLLICSILTGCSLKEKTLAEFYTKNLDYVTKIEILDGSTGYKKVVTEKKLIDDFLKEINDITFIPEEDQSQRVGFLYAVTFVQEEGKTFSFTLNNINGDYYYTEPDIYPIVDAFYQNLEIEEQ